MSQTPVHNQKPTWKRLCRELFRLLMVLVLLEIVVRIEPLRIRLDESLSPYENLLWYSENMPSYQDQLVNGPHFEVWMGGSSYMMTSLQPEWIKSEVEAQGVDRLSFQNYGLTTMQNLRDMADIYDRWMLQKDQPDYMVLAISMLNFTPGGGQLPSRARSSPMERAFIFPTSIDDYAAGWLYQNSALYRYTLLARNATFIPREQTAIQPMPLGGFVEDASPFAECDPGIWVAEDSAPGLSAYSDFSSLDYFIDVFRARGIPVAVVNIPLQYCALRRTYPDYEDYAASYLKPVGEHLQSLGIPFFDLDTPFRDQIPEDQQYLYFRDYTHPNSEAAKLLSQWTGEFLADWLKKQ